MTVLVYPAARIGILASPIYYFAELDQIPEGWTRTGEPKDITPVMRERNVTKEEILREINNRSIKR